MMYNIRLRWNAYSVFDINYANIYLKHATRIIENMTISKKQNKQHLRAHHSNTENLNEFYFASMRIRFMCVLWVLAYITICNQTMSSIRMDLCHFQILRESLKRMRINFLCDTRVCIVYNFR